MIGRLRGVLVHKTPPDLLIDVHGVAYEVEAPLSTFYDLGETGTEVTLLTHLVVRDDAHVLYGFATEAERRLFRALIKISGVGAKMALAVLSGIGVDEFAQCVERGDAATRQVQSWRRSGQLPFPDMPRSRREQLADTLDYPPHGSPDADYPQAREEEAAEPLSKEPDADEQPDEPERR